MDNGNIGDGIMNQAYTLADAVQSAIEQRLSEIHTCLPASVERYDGAKRQADVKPLVKRRFTDGTVLPMPIITNVPVVFLGSSDTVIHFPIKKGDTVLLVFAERSIDGWLSAGGEVDPQDTRKFALSDAIAIPGLFPFNASNPANSSPDDLVLSHKGQTITVKANGDIEIGINGQTVMTKAYADALVSYFAQIVTACAAIPYTLAPFSPPLDGLTEKVKAQ